MGVSALIIVTSVMNGFRNNLYDRILGMNGHITIFAYQGHEIPDIDALKKNLESDPNIISATPVVQSEILVSVKKVSDGAYIKAVAPEDFNKREFFRNSLIFDDYTLDGAEILADNKIIIGAQMARHFGVQAGDSLTFYSPFGHQTAFGVLPKLVKIEIGGIFSFDMFQYDRNFVFMNLRQAQRLFNKNNGISRIELFTKNPNFALKYNEAVKEALPSGLYSSSWLELNGSVYQAIEIERRVAYIVLTLIVLIAALNIISAQMMLVKEKSRSIAILRSMGARRNDILKIFTFTGSFIGIAGTVSGGIVGVLIASNIDILRRSVERLLSISLFNQNLYHLEELPAQLNNSQTFVTLAMALIVSIVAALYPAYKAANLKPVEVLRNE